MPLYPGGPRVGLGLWNSAGATFAVELPLFAAGVWIYLRATRARDAAGRWAVVLLTGLLLAAYFGSLAGTPPSVTAVWAASIVGAALGTVLSWWTDRHREAAPRRT
jgi:membrane associated rhomboid family serine protease